MYYKHFVLCGRLRVFSQSCDLPTPMVFQRFIKIKTFSNISRISMKQKIECLRDESLKKKNI